MGLEVGDVLYNGDNTIKISIDRVTAKRAYSGKHYEFDREVPEHGSIRLRGADTWSRNAYWSLATPKLDLAYQNVLRTRLCMGTLDHIQKELHTYTPEQIIIVVKALYNLKKELGGIDG